MRHANRIEDQPHAVVLLPEHRRVTDARQALDVVEDTQRDKVREKKGILLRIVRLHDHDGQEVRRHFLDRDPLPHDFRRQLWLGQFLAILGLDLCDIDVGPDLEREPDAHVPIVRTRRIEVEKVVDAGKLQFDRARHGFRHDLRTGSRIIGLNLHHRRRDFRKLRDGQGLHRNQSHHDDDDGENRRENRTIDKHTQVHLCRSISVTTPEEPAALAAGDT